MAETKTILLVSEACPACTEAETLLEPSIKNGEINVVEVSKDPKVDQILKQVQVTAVPECIREEDGKFSKCDIEELLRKKAVQT